MKSPRMQRLLQAWRPTLAGAFGALVALLASCGGGVGSGGTGAPVGYASGTVTGFGSVIVDGTHFDDVNAVVDTEVGPGQVVPAESRLGQHVEVAYQTLGVATAVHVAAQVSGPVSAVAAPNSLTVLGQAIRINADANAGPATVFAGGYAGISSIAVGDAVEVHGLQRQDDSGAGFIHATRIEKLAALPSYLRVTGPVSRLDSSARSFMLGNQRIDYSAASLLPQGAVLANGQTVLVFGSALQTGNGGQPVLTAQLVRVKQVEGSGTPAYLGGTVSRLDAASASFLLDGTTVHYSGAAVLPTGRSLASGVYVRVQGSFSADGSLAASQVFIRNQTDEAQLELSGTLSGYNAATQSFQVRNVLVNAASATLVGCSAGLGNGLYVQVEGGIVNGAAVATQVSCVSAPPGAVVDSFGVAGSVNIDARTFTLTPTGGAAIAVSWTGLTYFGDGLTPGSLSGQTVEVEGVFSGSVLTATKVTKGG
ncbi:MAG TPA: DUF5666 domain-containing protein [Methylibium sp.]